MCGPRRTKGNDYEEWNWKKEIKVVLTDCKLGTYKSPVWRTDLTQSIFKITPTRIAARK